MKKVLSIVLSLAMVVCMMPLSVFAASAKDAAYSDIAGEKCEGAVNVLSALGVVDGYEDGSYKPANIVTRAEMAKLIITALGMESYATATTSSYTDMINAKWAIPVVEYATNLGIINGYGNGKFGPNDTVTYEQAATMIVRALGFTTDCNEMNGTWPAIYVQKATALGIFKDVEGNQYGTGANRGDVAIMLYNALDTPEVYADKDGETHNKTGENGTKITMMSTLNKGGTSEYDVLTPEDADDAVTNVMDLIGAAGKIVKDKNGKVLSVGDIQTVFLTGDYNGTKFVVGDTEYTISSNAYTQFVEKTTTGKTEPADDGKVYSFVNNKAGAEGALTLPADKKKVTYTIACKVSGTTIKNIFSIAQWNANNAKQVKTGDIKKITSDKTLLGYDFQKDDNGAIDTSKFILEGVASLNDIKEDNVVAVYTDTDNSDAKITKVAVGTEVVTGKVTKKTTSGDTKYTVDGKEYKVSTLPKAEDVNLSVGDEVTLYLDSKGKIYATDSVESNYNYGVVLKEKDASGTYDNDDQLIKILGADGNAKIYNVKDSVTQDPAVGDLVRFKLNSDSKITEIAIAEANANGSKYKNGVIAGKLVADNAVAFILTDADAMGDADSYDVSKPSAITDDITSSKYFTNKDGEIIAIIVDEAATDSTDIFGLINSKSEVRNDKDDDVFELTGVANGAAFTALTKNDTAASYETRDNVLVKITKSGDVIKSVEAAQIGDASAVKTETEFTTGDKDAYAYKNGSADPYTVMKGSLTAYQVLKLNGDRVQIGKDKAVEYQTIKGATVYIPTLDSDKAFDSWAVGSLDDISVNGYVVLLQTNKKSSNWDTIIYIPDGKDYQKLVELITK